MANIKKIDEKLYVIEYIQINKITMDRDIYGISLIIGDNCKELVEEKTTISFSKHKRIFKTEKEANNFKLSLVKANFNGLDKTYVVGEKYLYE